MKKTKRVSDFQHEVTTEKKPWTHLDFGDRGGEDFCFAIMSDRSGRPRPGVFENTILTMNKLRPEFVMSVGDFIEGISVEDQSRNFLMRQWKKIIPAIRKCIPPFFYVVGNHDVSCYLKQFPKAHDTQEKRWKDLFGVDHYYFVYKNVLFLCLNSNDTPEGIGDEQLKWAQDVLHKHENVRWTFVFQHSPHNWTRGNFLKLEETLYDRNYTVFSGDLHKYCKYVRNGRKYFMLGMTGCGEDVPGIPARGVIFGEFEHITWVSMCGDKPEIMNIALDGMFDENVVTTEKITWLTPKYFRANKKISHAEAQRLRSKGIQIEETEF